VLVQVDPTGLIQSCGNVLDYRLDLSATDISGRMPYTGEMSRMVVV
jgi:hypothetical protein